MGKPIIQPVIPEKVSPGDPCSVCWGPGKEFGDIDTPVDIIATFSGINKRDDWREIDGEPYEGEVFLAQHPSLPCYFGVIIDLKIFSLIFEPWGTSVKIERSGMLDLFSGASILSCDWWIDNETQYAFEGGSCVLTLPETWL